MDDLRVSIWAIAPAELASWEDAWTVLEARAGTISPFLTFTWLSAWAAVYRPPALLIACIGEREAPLALGLLETARAGRWSFAGRPVTSERGLLCQADAGSVAWDALGAWLRRHPDRWATLDADGLPEAATDHLPRARATPVAVPTMPLPEDFETYLAERPRSVERRFRRILRRIDRDGAQLSLVPAGRREDALEDFVRLHRRRASSLGERHPAVDERLARMLARLADRTPDQVHLLQLIAGGRRIGVTVRLDRGQAAWFYNGGIDPDAVALSPGIALQLASVRDAIARGVRHYDLGPGAHPYKLELGGVAAPRISVSAASASFRGRAISGSDALRRSVRRRAPGRGALRRVRQTLAGR